jgi:hypothetical protein
MKNIKLLIYAILVTFTISAFTIPVYAASLYLGGSSSVTAGSTISISIVVGTCYGVEGTIEFDTSKLSFVSSSAGSGWNATYASGQRDFQHIETMALQVRAPY